VEWLPIGSEIEGTRRAAPPEEWDGCGEKVGTGVRLRNNPKGGSPGCAASAAWRTGSNPQSAHLRSAPLLHKALQLDGALLLRLQLEEGEGVSV
jgi:hypothetical protein